MRRWTAAILILALAACTDSAIDANAKVVIAGHVQRADGTAASDARVALTKEGDLGEGLTVFFTLGLACLEDRAAHICGDARLAKTDDTGRYRYELRGRDTQGFFGQASTLELTSRLPRAAGQLEGPVAITRFMAQTEQLRIPLRFWEPSVAASTRGGDLRVRFDRVPSTVAPPGTSLSGLRYTIAFADADTPVWTFARARSGGTVDARLLEDTFGTFAVRAETRRVQVDASAGTRIDLLLRSGAYGYRGPAGAPPSRGMPCLVELKRRTVAQAGCTLTDGDFREGFEPVTGPPCTTASCTRPEARAVIIDLTRQRSIDLVAIRGCAGRCTVETSRDGTTWRFRGSGGDGGVDEDVALPVPKSPRARYVRIASDGGIDGIREVSIWDPPKPLGAITLPDDAAPAGAGPTPDGRPIALLVLAGALLVLLIAGGAYLLGRRARAA